MQNRSIWTARQRMSPTVEVPLTVLPTITALDNSTLDVESSANCTRLTNRCPVCGSQYGRAVLIESEELPGAKYYHTDLVDIEESCIEWADGQTEQIEQ